MRQIEQSQAVFGIAQQTGAIYWRAGCWFRIGCVAAMWALLTAAGPPDFGRAAVQLTVTTLGVAIAFLHTRVDTLALLRGTRWRPAKRLAEHLLGTPGRAAIDVSGLCEIIGAFAALWLFAGPWPVAGLTRLEQVFAVVAAVLYSLSAALQGMLDPGWYQDREELAPSRAMRRLRISMPLIFCAMLGAYLFPYNAVDRRLGWPLYLGLTLTPLLFYPLWSAFDVILRSAGEHTRTRHAEWEAETSSSVHSIMRNAVWNLTQYAALSDADPGEIGRLAREALLAVEEFRRDMALGAHGGPRRARSFHELWELTLRTFHEDQQSRCLTDAESREVLLEFYDYHIARRLLPDFLTNAVNAGATRVRVSLASRPGGELVLTVADDGRGLPDGQSPDTRSDSSSALLKRWLSAYNGGVAWQSAADGAGTAVEARWRIQGG